MLLKVLTDIERKASQCKLWPVQMSSREKFRFFVKIASKDLLQAQLRHNKQSYMCTNMDFERNKQWWHGEPSIYKFDLQFERGRKHRKSGHIIFYVNIQVYPVVSEAWSLSCQASRSLHLVRGNVFERMIRHSVTKYRGGVWNLLYVFPCCW